MNVRQRVGAALGVGGLVGAVGYTIWSLITERHIGGWIIHMQAWSDDGRYGTNYSWVMTFLILLGLAFAAIATVALVRAPFASRRPPEALRRAARAKRLTIAVPALAAFALGAAVSAFLLVGQREAAESLGWFTKLALFALPLALFAWVALTEALAPAGWHTGHVASRELQLLGDGEPVRNIDVDGFRYGVSPEDYERATEGTLVGVLHTGGLFRLVIAIHTDLDALGGPPVTF